MHDVDIVEINDGDARWRARWGSLRQALRAGGWEGPSAFRPQTGHLWVAPDHDDACAGDRGDAYTVLCEAVDVAPDGPLAATFTVCPAEGGWKLEEVLAA